MARQEVTFAVTGITIDILLISEADNVTRDILEIVTTEELQRFNEEKVIGIEPIKYGLLKEMQVIITGLTREYIAKIYV